MASKTFQSLKKELVNRAYIMDFLASDGSVIPDLSGYGYEHKYYLPTLKKIQNLIDNKQQHIKEMKNLFSDCKISYTTCRFYFKGLEVPLDIQKELLKLQKDIYDDVTVQMINGQFDNFKEMFEFAKKLEMPIATLIDLKKREEELISDVKFIAEERKNISYTKWLWGKMDTWIRNYTIVRNAMNKIEMSRVLTRCNKRCAIENYKEIAIPIVAIAYYGFTASCMEFKDKTIKSKSRFAPYTDIFNSIKWEYEKKQVKNYRDIRLNNLKEINNTIDSISPQEIAKRPRVQALFQKLASLEAQ